MPQSPTPLLLYSPAGQVKGVVCGRVLPKLHPFIVVIPKKGIIWDSANVGIIKIWKERIDLH